MTRTSSLLFFALLFAASSASCQHPFKYDNTTYKAVYPNDAFRLMETSPVFLLLDVRSPGEYADTSRATALNIGRLKGALNITIDSVENHIKDIEKYKNEPVFIYCSHSQRSRRVSKLLSENGFLKVYNINGGMSYINESDAKSFLYKDKVLVTNTAYKNIASTDAIKLIQNKPGLAIIDIRTKKEFDNKDSLLQNNIGYLKNAINIPQDVFASTFDQYNITSNRPVLLYDLDGVNSMDVVDILRAKGFTEIYNLFEGLSPLSCDEALNKNLRQQLFVNTPAWNLLDTKACIDLMKANSNLVIIDARTAAEFDNKADPSYHNLGRMKGAVNVPSLELLDKVTEGKNKSTVFLIYGWQGDLSPAICDALVKKGFKNVNQMRRGFYRFVWASANIENCKEARSFLVNHEGLY